MPYFLKITRKSSGMFCFFLGLNSKILIFWLLMKYKSCLFFQICLKTCFFLNKEDEHVLSSDEFNLFVGGSLSSVAICVEIDKVWRGNWGSHINRMRKNQRVSCKNTGKLVLGKWVKNQFLKVLLKDKWSKHFLVPRRHWRILSVIALD